MSRFSARRQMMGSLPFHATSSPSTTSPVGSEERGHRPTGALRSRWCTRTRCHCSALRIGHAAGTQSAPWSHTIELGQSWAHTPGGWARPSAFSSQPGLRASAASRTTLSRPAARSSDRQARARWRSACRCCSSSATASSQHSWRPQVQEAACLATQRPSIPLDAVAQQRRRVAEVRSPSQRRRCAGTPNDPSWRTRCSRYARP
jgi:hypothetical protein